MSNITVNVKKGTIEMSKAYADLASKFDTKEYDDLQKVRRDYPNYYVVIKAKKGGNTDFKGLTYKYMEEYIASHDNDEKSIMAEYQMLTAKSEAGKDAKADAAHYTDVKEWFLMTYPEIENYRSKRDALLEKIAQRRAEKKALKKVS